MGFVDSLFGKGEKEKKKQEKITTIADQSPEDNMLVSDKDDGDNK